MKRENYRSAAGRPPLQWALSVLGLLVLISLASGQTVPLRGLWVGQATLSYVNEVSVALDENNVAIAPDPNTPTPTADQAHLRLILHVNGAGQTHLLKDVAILNRTGGTVIPGSGPINLVTNVGILSASSGHLNAESDIALVSDERLYGQFPPQPAIRIASAVFDFGDSRATEAVNEVLEAVANAAAISVTNSTLDLSSSANRQTAQNNARQAATNAAGPIIANAEVAAAFNQFLTGTNFTANTINAMAAAANPASVAQNALVAATNLQNRSFYGDSRAIEMIHAVIAAIESAGSGLEKTNAGHNMAAAYADVTNSYQRFIAGKLFGDMIVTGAQTVATAAVIEGASEATIRVALTVNPVVNQARGMAVNLRVGLYQDRRATVAVEQVLDAMVATAVAALPAPPTSRNSLASEAEEAGRTALATQVIRFPISADVPTPEYTAFIRSTDFQESGVTAASAAAEAAVSEKRNNALFTFESVKGAAKVAAAQALRNVSSAAARAVRTELPLAGTFGPGEGDPRLSFDIKQTTNGTPLGMAALTGTIHLPASHPTNPFRHRRHPDHTVGFDITRHIRFDFDGSPTNGLARAGFGVDRVTGTFREEVFGLHKPLGPRPDTEPIGLKVEGRFELNRLSLIDTLNAQ